MLLKIAQLGQPVLRQMATPVSPAEIASAEFQTFVDAMIATLADEQGAGLAAPQVFVSKRVFLAAVLPPEDPDSLPGVEVVVNPVVEPLGPEARAAWEGCLSFPELLVLVARPVAVRVNYLNRYGQPAVLELAGFPARVIQHEFDHLDGILTLDRAVSSRHIIKASEADVLKTPPKPDTPAEESEPE